MGIRQRVIKTLPQVTTAQRTALTGLNDGDQVYDTDLKRYKIRTNGAWATLLDDSYVPTIVDGEGIDSTYDSGANTLTLAVDPSEFTGSGSKWTPVVAGGTGAGDAVSAMENLKGAYQVGYDPGRTRTNLSTENSMYTNTLPSIVTPAVGDTFRHIVTGTYTNNSGASRTFTPRLKIGGVAIFSPTTGAITVNANPRSWGLITDFTVLAVGVSGQVSVTAELKGTAAFSNTPDSAMNQLLNGPSVGIDFSTPQSVEFTVQHSVANASLSIVASSLILIKFPA